MSDKKNTDKGHESVLSKLNESDRKPSEGSKDSSDASVLSELNDKTRK